MKPVKLKIKNLAIDCTDAERAYDFYAELMGWERINGFDYPALKTDNGLIILFTVPDIPYVPPIWPEESDKQQKQMHLDLTVNDLSFAINKAIQLGAVKTAAQFGGINCITMLDTEGHPFCLGKRSETKSEFDLYYERNGYGSIPDISINIDCQTQKTLRDFYIELTGWDSEFHPAVLIADNGMIVCFQGCDVDATMDEYIPPVYPEQPGKQQKQMQFTFQTDNIQSDTLFDFDIDGHPFCISGIDHIYHGKQGVK